MTLKAAIKTLKSNKISLLILIFFVAVYLVTRLQNLISLPVFADEAIYIRWSQIIRSVETLRFIPLTDGKQPLFMWLTVPFLKLFSDPLFAGRFVSVASGLVTLFTLYFIARLFKLSRLSLIFLLTIYTVSPFTFFFDRMALADNLLTAFGVLAFYLTCLQAKYLRLDLSFILGAVLGFAWLTKSPAIIFISLSTFFVIFRQRNFQSLFFSLVSFCIAFSMYNILRLGPQFHMIALRNQDYVWSLADILRHPLDPLKPHLSDIFTLYATYLPGLVLMVLFLLALHVIFYKKLFRPNFLLLISFLWWLPPLIFNAMFAKVFTARYILYTVPPLFIFLTLIFEEIKLSPYLKILGLFFPIILGSSLLLKLSLTPFLIKLPSTETGYIDDWTAGWGIHDIASYLITRSQTANVIVGTEGFFGTLPDGLEIYTNGIPHLTVFGVGVNLSKIPDKLLDAKNHGDEVYLVINTNRLLIPQNQVNIQQRYPKPDGSQLLLIRI